MNIQFKALASQSWEMVKGTALMGLSCGIAVCIIRSGGPVGFSAWLNKGKLNTELMVFLAMDIMYAMDHLFDRMGWPERGSGFGRTLTMGSISLISSFAMVYYAAQGNRIAAYLVTANIVYVAAILLLYGAEKFSSGLKGASQAIFP